jgi:D-xylose transport system substrate-binding protein
MQAQSLVDKVPQGNYFLMGGSPVDNNAKLFRAGQMKVLKPYIDEAKLRLSAISGLTAGCRKMR